MLATFENGVSHRGIHLALMCAALIYFPEMPGGIRSIALIAVGMQKDSAVSEKLTQKKFMRFRESIGLINRGVIR
jgi:hypothetical protein